MSETNNSDKKVEKDSSVKKEKVPEKMSQSELEALFEVYLQMKNYIADKQKNK